MSIWPWKKKKEESLDRRKFLSETRSKLLENHGLPTDTPPEQTEGLLRMRRLVDRINNISEKNENKE